MCSILGIPAEREPLDPRVREIAVTDNYCIEAVDYVSETGSRVTASLYLPVERDAPVPAIVVACGHGGSKSCFYAQYAGQLYASLGFACLIPDTIGEEEREATGRMGARGHDVYHFGSTTPEFAATRLKRLVVGKIVLDLIRGIDYLESRSDIDPGRIGIVGYSLGGTTAGCVATIDERVRAAVICGWIFSPRFAEEGKWCSRMPYTAFARIMGFDEMTALLAPHCASLFMVGAKDNIIDKDGDGANTVRELETILPAARRILADVGIEGNIDSEIVSGAGHRPFFLSHRAVDFLLENLMHDTMRRPVPQGTVGFGEWVDSQGASIEPLYNTERNERGLDAVDIGAVLRMPEALACNPGVAFPAPEYTMSGWVGTVVRNNFPEDHARLLQPQDWERDSDGPVVSLGEPEDFDDTHVFAPLVAFENGRWSLWYCGSRGAVAERIFRLGLAVSDDGVTFKKTDDSPVYEFGDGKRSVLTPILLRSPDGAVLRENGSLRMWFAAADLTVPGGLHTLHETSSDDGVTWSSPSEAQLDNVYAPTIIREGDTYRMWYTDVSAESWVIRHAFSRDGKRWTVSPKPAVAIDQAWEKDRLFYPTVLKKDGFYIMWYGSYWTERDQTTAIGSAVSADGLLWDKNPSNPVMRPDPSRPWESHYTTSQSVMCLPDGSWRIWYATRKAPPFVNKYYAIGTARRGKMK